jgi:pyruvate, water dikinase
LGSILNPEEPLHFDNLADELAQREIAQLTAQYDHKPDFFVDKLASGIGMFRELQPQILLNEK